MRLQSAMEINRHRGFKKKRMSIIFLTHAKVESMSRTLRFPNVRWESLLAHDFTWIDEPNLHTLQFYSFRVRNSCECCDQCWHNLSHYCSPRVIGWESPIGSLLFLSTLIMSSATLLAGIEGTCLDSIRREGGGRRSLPEHRSN
jgi:hypothetical protein